MQHAIVTPGGNKLTVGNVTSMTNADTDAKLIDLFLNSRVSPNTQRAYTRSIEEFLQFVDNKPLRNITLDDSVAYLRNLPQMGIALNSQKLKFNVIKSLFSFAVSTGYIPLNPFAPLKAPKGKEGLAARILTEDEVLSMIHKTTKQRDQVLLRLLYASAGRISEICNLTWKDVSSNGDSGQVVLFGKGGKTRTVKLSKATYKALCALDNGVKDDSPVFVSQKGGRLDETQVHRIVKTAAQRAGISGNVSAHWLRHSHASHALDRGANIALVRDTLGHSSLAVTSRYTHAKPNESSALHLAV